MTPDTSNSRVSDELHLLTNGRRGIKATAKCCLSCRPLGLPSRRRPSDVAPEDESNWDAGLDGLAVFCATLPITGHANGGGWKELQPCPASGAAGWEPTRARCPSSAAPKPRPGSASTPASPGETLQPRAEVSQPWAVPHRPSSRLCRCPMGAEGGGKRDGWQPRGRLQAFILDPGFQQMWCEQCL